MAERPAFAKPRWGLQTTLFQWRQPALYVFGLLLLLTSFVTIFIQAGYSQISGGGWALSWFLLLLYAVPMFVLIYRLDLYEREPMSLVVASLLWGGVVATTLAGLANVGWGAVLVESFGGDFASRWGAALTAPWTEEVLKAAGVVLIYLIARREIDDMLDGFVYGAMVGLGFTVVEDVFYFMTSFGGQTGGVLTGFYVRVISSGLYGHVLYTGLAGMGIAYFVTRWNRPMALRLAVGVGLFVLAMAGHFVWNSPLLDLFPELPLEGLDYLQIVGATAVRGVPLLLVVILLVTLAHRREDRYLEAALAHEVGGEGITREEWEQLRTTRTRRRGRREMKARAGPVAAKALKRLQRAQINLAMRSTWLDPDHVDVQRQREYCRLLREWLYRMPGARPVEPVSRP